MTLLQQTDSIFWAGQQWDRSDVARTLDDALLGMDDGELFLESMQSESFFWDDGRLKKASYDRSQGFGLRAVLGDAVGYAHADDWNMSALMRAADAVRGIKSNPQGGQWSCAPAQTDRTLYSDVNPLTSRGFSDKIALLETIDAYLRARDPRVKQVSLSLMAGWKSVQIMRPQDWRCADIRPMVRLNISVVVSDGVRTEGGGTGYGGRMDYARCFDSDQWKAAADEALRKAIVNLDAVDAPAGEMTVVLGPGWPAVLLHEAIGHGLEGDFNRKKVSAFAGLLGQRVAAKGVTIVDDGTLPDLRGSLTVDDEGTPTQCTTLIEDGILVGYMQDRLNARLMGTVSTGNGRRESYASQPYPRMTNTMMLAGTMDPSDIIASVDKGVYAVDFGGGQVDITSGKFVFSASEAYEIRQGKIGRPLKGASLVGTGFETLKQVSMIGNDTRLDGGIGTCGKNGQSVPVGVGQPTMRIDQMTVGGVAVD